MLVRIKKQNRKKIEEEKLLPENSRMEKEKEAEEKNNKNLLACFESLQSAIKTRIKIFISKCSVDLGGLNDFEFLEIKKRVKNMHVKFRELIDKVSNFKTCGNLWRHCNWIMGQGQ